LRRRRTRHLTGPGGRGDLQPDRDIADEREPRREDLRGKLAPGLYLVATPIGNLEDLTRRAERVLGTADLVACEDRRITSRLMAHLGLHRPLALYHEHNAEAARPELL
jgi:16S rRNA (cytidine1402-2'-O)-methyltransferase